MIVTRYLPGMQPLWDDFVRASKNGTFLVSRDYMNYHAERFIDHSLIINDDKGRPVAVMPAHSNGSVLLSHGGLTYGGIISNIEMTTPLMLDIFDSLMAYARAEGIARINYKTIPCIYHRVPAEEDRYALFRHDARLCRRDVLAVVDQGQRLGYQGRRMRKIKQARKAQLQVIKSDDYADFWRILQENLLERFGVHPIHSLTEIEFLAQCFPDNIHLYLCSNEREVLAGVITYITPQAIHVQYISASESGKKQGALDLIFAELLDVVYVNYRYFDFGISTEQDGRYLNLGLVEHKEGFGARAMMHDHYEITVK